MNTKISIIMNNTFRTVLLMITLTLVTMCSNTTTEPSDFDIQNLYKTWVSSFEEQSTDAIHVYRPDYYIEFLPSRFRMKYIFEQDGFCQWLVLAANDRHYLNSGNFEITGKDKSMVLIYDIDGVLQENVSFIIVDLQENLLEITSIETENGI